VIDPSITAADFGLEFLAGKSSKTARRVIERDGIPHYRVNGHLLIKRSVAEAWREARMQTPSARDLKTTLAECVQRARARRRAS
jgi:hypothetical protein